MTVKSRTRLNLDPAALEAGTPDAFVGEYVEHWARKIPDSPSLTFIDYFESRAGVEYTTTFAELELWTRAIAARIAAVTQPGDRVAILAPQGREYCAAFVGALRTHAVNVPLYAPDMPGQGDRLVAVMADCAPTAILTTSAKRELVEAFSAQHGGPSGAQVICVDDLISDAVLADTYEWPADLSLGDPAYLQYTSGSTRVPAGVVITHHNLTSNVVQFADGNDLRFRETVCASWLPLFHDMGLLMGLAGPVIGGCHGILLDPVAFILKPSRWLQALSGRKPVITAAPNFAYDYVVKRTKDADREALDLSGVVVWLNGAEPVHAATLARFQESFAEQGVSRTALTPAYGLAEATVFVAGTPPGAEPSVIEVGIEALQHGLVEPASATSGHATTLVSSGRPVGQKLVIVDPDTAERVPDARVGEIWVHGPNVGDGYWRKPDATAALFEATLAGAVDLPADGWLRTQDLGFIAGGDLYVTGRIKDLIIIDGRNIYPQDIEGTVELSDDVIARRRLAAFAITEGEHEAIVVVAERHRDSPDAGARAAHIAAAAKAAVTEQHAVALHDFVLVEPDTIHRTSSGKIARAAIRDAYLRGELAPVAAAPA